MDKSKWKKIFKIDKYKKYIQFFEFSENKLTKNMCLC